MNTGKLEQISRASGSDSRLEYGSAGSGVFWQSMHQLPTQARYSIEVPTGLHLACGFATLETQAPGLGGFALPGGGLTAMLCADETPHASTRISAGPNRSCGLHLPDAAADSPLAEAIVARLRSGPRMRATSHVPPGLLAQVCAPVDPWFQGHARALAMEARALELMAMVWTWLDGAPERLQRPSRHAQHARRAREVLEARLQSPPSLAALAREVGVNVRTLTAAFREAYGTTIAGYVTARRLQVARDGLLQGMSVSSAAYRVGYTPAHFSNAFQRHYGLRPQQFVAGFPASASEMPDSA